MFSDAWVQEALALAVVTGGAAYLVHRLFGQGAHRRNETKPVAVSDRLARGLTHAQKRGSRSRPNRD